MLARPLHSAPAVLPVLAAVPAIDRAPAVAAHGLRFAYSRGRLALDDVSLEVGQGEICMILGPSGSGKSTFLKAVKGLVTPERGSIALFGVSVANGRRRSGWLRLAGQVAYIPQHLGLVRNLSVLENTLIGSLSRTGTFASLLKLFSRDELRKASALLDSLGIGHKADEPVYNLSGGERQRVSIARALMQDARLVLADEFVSHLDPMTTAEIMALVKDIARRGVSFLITSHEIPLVSEYGDRAVFFRHARKVHECNAREVDVNQIASLMGRR
jgi:phosphonate transport system ATP-binding protein